LSLISEWLDRTPWVFTLYNAGARAYDSGTGRWLQEDPIVGIKSDPMSFNRYLYCSADPVNNSDPSGLRQAENAGGPPGHSGQAASAGPNGKKYRSCPGLNPCPETTRPEWFGLAVGALGAGAGGAAGGFLGAGWGGGYGAWLGEDFAWATLGRLDCYTPDKQRNAFWTGAAGGVLGLAIGSLFVLAAASAAI
jgi:RHS repeat-associated protein